MQRKAPLGIAILSFALASWPALAKPVREAAPLAAPGGFLVLGESKLPGPRVGLCYAWNGQPDAALVARDQPPSTLVDLRHSLVVTRDGQEYYLNKNRFVIARRTPNGETKHFTHTTYVRALALDGDDNVYFSESSGAGADGKIYRLRQGQGNMPDAELVYVVRLADVLFWAGDFSFGRKAGGGIDTDEIYLSSGNMVPASIYRVTRQGKGWNPPAQLLNAKTTIMGLLVSSPRTAYYVSGNRVFRLTNLQNPEVVLTVPDAERLTGLVELPGNKAGK